MLNIKHHMNKQNKGFTLIEVLIVISIIGLLSAVTLIGLGGFRASGRDARRVADLRQIQNGLEVYYARNNSYPAAAGGNAIPAGIGAVSADPLNTGVYVYSYAPCGTTGYVLKAVMEDTNSSNLKNDVDGTVCTLDCADPAYCIQF